MPSRPFADSSSLQAALREITETLAGELAHPSPHAPAWSDFEWRVARAVMAMHGVSPLLARRLQWQGPEDWRRFLEEQRTHTAVRHGRIEELLRRIDSAARAQGIPMVALKGAALHAMGVYQAGERPMADIDLLVLPQDAGRTAQLLIALGYRAGAVCWKEQVFIPLDARTPGALGEHAGNAIKIELHQRIGERLPLDITDISDCVFSADAHPGVNGYPSRAALMLHLLLHAAGAMVPQALRLLHLEDIARLGARLTPADWEALLAHGTDRRGPW